MVGESKILTVSYGTFSCTLEGFEDSFSTMKAIAEYFRDLAADDRYFGAEPPTPDAEMLAKIAEREINQRVEAQIQDQTVLLRAAPEDAEGEITEKTHDEFQPTPEVEVEDRIEAAPEQDDEEPELVEETAEAVDEIEEPVSASFEEDDKDNAPDDLPGAESVAAKLQRIRAVVARNQAANTDAAVDADAAQSELSAEEQRERAQAFFSETEENNAVEEVEYVADEADTELDDHAEADFDEAEPEAEFDAIENEAAEADPDSATDDVEEQEEDDIVADFGADEITAILNQVEENTSETEEVDDDASEDEGGSLKSLVEEINGEFEPAEPMFEEAGEAENLFADEQEEPETEIEADAEQAATEIEPEPLSPEAEEEPAEEDTSSTRVSAAVLRARARVIKMRKADFVEAVDSGEIEGMGAKTEEPVAEDEPEPEQVAETEPENDQVAKAETETEQVAEAEPEVEQQESALSEQDEADLQEALEDAAEDLSAQEDASDEEVDIHDEPEAEVEAAEQEPEDVDAEEIDDQPVAKGRAILDSESTEDEASVARLLEETNSQFDNPETSRRRSAISHLRAAVAATVADRLVKKSDADDRDEKADPYRADLASVVKPRSQDEVPEVPEKRGAPLVLVSEQRIQSEDASTPQAASPVGATVAPRRVGRTNLALQEVDETFAAELDATADTVGEPGSLAEDLPFADFALSMQAEELPELLEAAGGYLVFVRGQEQFSRPQVLRLVSAQLGEDSYKREDGLRAFGQLLRDGRIIKIRRGKFEIAEDTRFKPEGS